MLIFFLKRRLGLNNDAFLEEKKVFILKEKNIISTDITIGEDFFGINNYEEIDYNSPNLVFAKEVLKKMSQKNISLNLLFNDFTEKVQVNIINTNVFLKEESLLSHFIKEYGYESDDGFLLLNKENKWGYFYGEDLFSNIRIPSSFETYHVFFIESSFETKFINILNQIVKNKIEPLEEINIITKKKTNVKEIILLNDSC